MYTITTICVCEELNGCSCGPSFLEEIREGNIAKVEKSYAKLHS